MGVRVWQEFLCSNCNGYIDVKLNSSITHEVEIICPNCQHEHRRCVKEGVLQDSGRYRSESREKIMPVKSAYHKEPKTTKMQNAVGWEGRRDGVTVQHPKDLINEEYYIRYGDPRALLKDSWEEKYGDRV